MSFGFSVGDFLAAAKLIHNVIESLQDVGGAKSEYQELIRELQSLEKALQHLDGLQSDSSKHDRTIQSIKFAALSCRQPLEQFLAKIKKFDNTLGVWAKGQTSKSIARKVHWGFSMRNEVTKLQGYLDLHIATINMLLAEHSLEKMDLAQKKVDSESLHVRERLDMAKDVIERTGNTVIGQMALVESTHATTRSMMNIICGEFRTSWKSLGQMVAQICVSMQQIYGIVLEIKASVTPVDTRFTFFQTPLVCEDALGFKFPIPSEWDYGMVENHIRYRLREGIGSRDVKAGNWELFKTKDSGEVISPLTRLLPGLGITMAIIVNTPILNDEICPIFSCRSHETTLAPTWGRICCTCGTYFSRANKKHVGLEVLAEVINSKLSETTCSGAFNDLSSSRQDEGTLNDPILRNEQDGLKNVRWSKDEDLGFASSLEEDESEMIDSSLGSAQEIESTQIALLDGFSNFLPDLRQQQILNDALSYLDQVKDSCGTESTEYNRFLDIIKVLKTGSVSMQGVIALFKDLFSGQAAILDVLKIYLPERQQEQEPILDDAFSYLDQVKSIYGEASTEYNGFLDILKRFKAGSVNTQGVITLLEDLFSGQTTLLDAFNAFLPPGYKIQGDQHLEIHPGQVISPENIVTSLVGAKRKQLDELDSQESKCTEDAMEFIDPQAKKQKKRH